MEPKILIIGRKQNVIDILVEELTLFGRDVRGADDKLKITGILQNQHINLVIIGAGLPDETREQMAAYVTGIRPDVGIHLIKRVENGSPYDMVQFINRKAVDWKVHQTLQKEDHV